MRTALIYPPGCLEHDTGRHHPEQPARLAAITEAITARWGAAAAWVTPAPASAETLALCHDPAYIRAVAHFSASGGGLWDADTVIGPATYEAASLAVGASLAAVDTALTGRPAFALVRPPGHHALADQAMGFCFFNNVAVAARYAQQAYGVGRVLIVDWDVHHGNGTQAIFYLDGTVAYFSTHQYPFYPMTGVATEMGAGDGYGAICNLPLPEGCRDIEYATVFREILTPFATRFQPELILVSAGYDAHRHDPLGGMMVSEGGFAALTAQVQALAATLCAGRLALVLEGGYDLDGLAHSVVATLETLDGAPPPVIPGQAAPTIQRLIAQSRTLHALDS